MIDGLFAQGAFQNAGNETPETLARKRQMLQALMGGYGRASNLGEGIGDLAKGIGAGIQNYRLGKAEEAGRASGNSAFSGIMSGAGFGDAPAPAPAPTAQAAPSSAQKDAPVAGDTAGAFLDTLKGSGLTNPYALAAVGATGHHESRWAPDKIAGSWSDPSQSGQPGTAGGALSWRADRLDRLRQFAAANGEQGNGSVTTQAKFFMQEDPQLVARLNAAKSPQEAMSLMNNAWRYAGYNKPDGETAERMQSAQQWAARYPFSGPAPQAQAMAPTATPAPQNRLANIAPMQPEGRDFDPANPPPGVDPEQAKTGRFWRNTPSPADNPQMLGIEAPQRPVQVAQANIPADPSRAIPDAPQALAQGAPAMPAAPSAQGIPGPAQLPPAQVPPRSIAPSLSVQQLLQASQNPWLSEQQRGVVNMLLKQKIEASSRDPNDARLKQLQVMDAEEKAKNSPLERRSKELAIQKTERELEGEGAVPLTEAERRAYGITQEQPAYRTRSGEIKFGPAASKTQVAIDQRQESEFGKATGAALAKRFDSLATEGDEAVQNQIFVDELRRLGGKIGTGGSAAFKKRLSDVGIKLEGASEIEAYSALVDRLTPQQRVPGAGATSDFDAKMFKGSLPQLMNTPDGNALIIDTMDKLNANKMARGDIAMRVQAGEIKPNEGIAEIRKLQAEARSLSDRVKDYGKPKDGASPAASQAAPQSQTPNRTKSGVTWSVE